MLVPLPSYYVVVWQECTRIYICWQTGRPSHAVAVAAVGGGGAAAAAAAVLLLLLLSLDDERRKRERMDLEIGFND